MDEPFICLPQPELPEEIRLFIDELMRHVHQVTGCQNLTLGQRDRLTSTAVNAVRMEAHRKLFK